MMQWWTQPVAKICEKSTRQAELRQQQLTKPPGSLGELEQIAIKFAGWQACEKPQLNKVCIRVFAGDHGVAEEGVSAFPQVVTAEMVRNFAAGGAAISILAKQYNADFAVVNLGTVESVEPLPAVVNVQIAPGTANFCQAPAMTEKLVKLALATGRDQSPESGDLFIGGEMGIGNTTCAAALYCAILGTLPEEMVGRGTGIDDHGLDLKLQAIKTALKLHKNAIAKSDFEILRCIGGLEVAALAGAYISCAQRAIPSLVDGFIATAAALVAIRLNPQVANWILIAHCSGESGHEKVLEMMKVEPLLKIGLRLGEGSGAALVYPLLQSALNLHCNMATFEQASVSGKTN